MKRLIPIITGIVLATLMVGATTAVAAWHRSPAFTARATDAMAGERMRVLARVNHADAGASFSASAVLHFQTGEVRLELVRVGDRYVARGRLTVDPAEPTGRVPVVVTIVHGDSSAVLSFSTEVLAEDEEDDPTEAPTPTGQPET